MVDENQPPSGGEKRSGKGAETALNLLSAIGGVAGQLIFGPDFKGDLGAPFRAGAQELAQKREEGNLLKYLNSTKATSPIAAHAGPLIDAGGIVNNTDLLNHPDVLSTFGLDSNANGPAASNMEKLSYYRPDLAEKVLTAQASRDPMAQTNEMLKSVLLGKEIANYTSPRELAQIKADTSEEKSKNLKDYAQKDKMSAMSAQEAAARVANESSLAHAQQLPMTISGKTTLASHLGPTIGSFVDPQLPMINEALQASKIQFGSGLKGARVHPSLIATLTQSFPDTLKNPETWPQTREQVISRLRFAQLAHDSDLAIRGKTLEGVAADHGGTPIMDKQDAQDFKDWTELFVNHPDKVMQSPKFMETTKKFGLEGLLMLLPKNQQPTTK